MKIGQYVMASKYKDGDPYDGFAVGIFNGMLEKCTCEKRYMVINNSGENFRRNGFRRCQPITHDEGVYICDNEELIRSASPKSVWAWLREYRRDKKAYNTIINVN